MDTFNEADPLTDHLQTILLPELEFTSASLEMVVECLRHMAARAMAASALPVPNGISITLLAPPSRMATPARLRVTLGMTLDDALNTLAAENGLVCVHGNVGVLICAPEMIACFQQLRAQDVMPPDAPHTVHPLNRDDRLRLLAFYPVLAVSNHPLRHAWMEAFLKSNGTPQAAYDLANRIVGRVEGDPCACLTQIPLYLTAPPEGPAANRSSNEPQRR